MRPFTPPRRGSSTGSDHCSIAVVGDRSDVVGSACPAEAIGAKGNRSPPVDRIVDSHAVSPLELECWFVFWSLPHQVYKRPAAIVDALVVALKAKFFQDPQRRFVPCPHG